jgi:hypothetical protein
VLIRDVNDTRYPNKEDCPGFDNLPRWKEYIACEFRAEGVRFHIREHFAYLNLEKKEWDCTPVIDLLYRESEGRGDDGDGLLELRRRVSDFWEHLPRANQARFIIDGIVLYERFAFIDKIGDPRYKFPHLYVEYGSHGPFDGHWKFITPNPTTFVSPEGYSRIEIFPKEFPNPTRGAVYRNKTIRMGQQNLARLQYNSRSVFFDIDNEYAFLEPRDVIQVASSGTKQETAFAALTHRLKCPVSKLYERHPHLQWELQERLGRVPDLAELCTCLSSSSYTRLSWTKPEPDETTRSACAMWRLERLEAVLGRLGIERIGGYPRRECQQFNRLRGPSCFLAVVP